MGQAMEQAERLVGVIRDILEWSVHERRRVEEARARAEETNRQFNEAIERARRRRADGEQPTIDHISSSLTPPGMPTSTYDLSESVRQSIQRETAICDAYDALIAVAAVHDLAEQVAMVAAALRDYRIYLAGFQLEELDDTAQPEFAPPPAEAMHDESICQRWKMDMAARVTVWSRERMDRSRIRHDRAMAESDRLLRRALEAAEQLLAAARAL